MRFFFIFILFFSFNLLAQPTVEVVNQVIYSSHKKSWTLRDLQLYQKIMNKYFQLDRISEISENASDDFLLSRLAFIESETFGMQSSDSNLPMPEVQKKLEADMAEYTLKEVFTEIKLIHAARQFLSLKKSQVLENERLRSWYEVLKRKNSIRKKN